MAAAASGLLAQTPIGNNTHFLQIIPGQLSIVQFKAPFQLNPDYILNLQCQHITTLFKFLPKILEIKPSQGCLLYTSPSPRDLSTSRMPSSA